MVNYGRPFCPSCKKSMSVECNEGGYCSKLCRLEGLEKDAATMGLYSPEHKGWTQAAVDYIEANDLQIDYDAFPE